MNCLVLGATGVIGQRFIERLARHPDLDVCAVAGSDRSAGKTYAQATTWRLDGAVPDDVASLPLRSLDDLPDATTAPVVFSALPSGIAGPIERQLAKRGHHVFTNAADLRMAPDVPLLIPEVNPDHIALTATQGTKGYAVANGNCTGIILTLALAPLVPLGIARVSVTSMQALSGAGHPGVSALDITGNVLVHIPGEEEKLETEPQKTLGALRDGAVSPADVPIHATCTRVAVPEGHLESVHVRFKEQVDARQAWRAFRARDTVAALPSAPRRPIHVLDGDRPQPRLDAMLEGGMAIAVGRIRPDADGRGVRFLALGSNTVRGAAGQSILNAEWAQAKP